MLLDKGKRVENPQISVIMSVYNGEQYLQQSICSILLQSFKNFEFIIVNDGSTDTTSEILQHFSKKDSRIKVINQENKGLTKSLNIAAEIAIGKYLARQDADDISLPSRLKKQYKYMQKFSDVKILGTSNYMMDASGKIINRFLRPKKSYTLEEYMPMGNQLCHGSVMIDIDIFRELKGYDESYRFAQDYELWFRALKHGYNIENLRSLLYIWRIHESSVSGSNLLEQKKLVSDIINRYTDLDIPEKFIYDVPENYLTDSYYLFTSLVRTLVISIRYPQLKFTFLKKHR